MWGSNIAVKKPVQCLLGFARWLLDGEKMYCLKYKKYVSPTDQSNAANFTYKGCAEPVIFVLFEMCGLQLWKGMYELRQLEK